MQKFILIFLCSFSIQSFVHAGQTIQCSSSEDKAALNVKIEFPTDDLSKYATFTASGSELFNRKNSKDTCQAFTMPGRKYYNTYTIHNFGCKTWSCSMHISNDLHGKAKGSFDGKMECYPQDNFGVEGVKTTLTCSSSLGN